MQKISGFESFLASKNYPVIAQKDRISIELINFVRPTHFITLSLLQGRRIFGENGIGTWVRGDDVIYDETHRSFVTALSKRASSKSNWKRHKRILHSICVIEGGANFERNHLHMLIALPGEIDDLKAHQLICETAEDNSWVMTGKYGVDIQRIGNCSDVMNYCTKHGLSRATYT
jgi:hypothetical protein